MWVKKGVLFKLDECAGRSTHTQVPTPYVMEDRVRVFYSCRNRGKSFIAYFDVSRDFKTILNVHEKPIIELGNPGMFDADGMMPSCILPMEDELWMYYIGWSALAGDARYQNEIGILVSKDQGETWERMFPGPIMGRSPTEPGLAVMPFVRQQRNGLFSMWYQSGTGWHLIDGKYEPTYVIKYASSHNGTIWSRNPDLCIDSLYLFQAFSRPWIVKIGEFDSMFYCVRGSADYRGRDGSYRIECADALDKINFMHSIDTPNLSYGGKDDFDSHMTCYPAVFEVDGRMIMLYNGNGFGQSGIGWAEWTS